MNREETSEAVKVMQAYVAGADIEWKPNSSHKDNWKPVRDPVWSWGVDKYRIKPAPAREFFIDVTHGIHPHGMHAIPVEEGRIGAKCIKVREVIENE